MLSSKTCKPSRVSTRHAPYCPRARLTCRGATPHGPAAAPEARRCKAVLSPSSFLPPKTTFAATNGAGEILSVAARQPEQPPLTGDEALQQKPLLPLAGSGKSFDPASGQWQPTETFATSAEHLTPRRIEHLALDGVTVERVFAADYKAATLTVDEAVLQPGKTLTVE